MNALTVEQGALRGSRFHRQVQSNGVVLGGRRQVAGGSGRLQQGRQRSQLQVGRAVKRGDVNRATCNTRRKPWSFRTSQTRSSSTAFLPTRVPPARGMLSLSGSRSSVPRQDSAGVKIPADQLLVKQGQSGANCRVQPSQSH